MYKAIGQLARRFGEFKGKRRAARVLLAPYISSAKNIEIKGKYDCSYVLPNINEPIAFDLFIDGIYEIETHNFLLSVMPPNAVYMDIGANIGSIAIPLCKRRADIQCVAVEASAWVYGYLVNNVRRNNLEKSITCINNAITDTAEGYVSFYTNENVFGKGSMSAVFSKEAIQVKRTTFQEIIDLYKFPRVDVIKIDIEGFENFAFKGGEKLLTSEEAPLILFEFVNWAEEHAGIQPGEAQRTLKNWGYTLYLLQPDGSLQKQDTVIEEGSAMLVASKKNLL